jgi:anti-anti-sigma regulatory factor
MLSIETAERRAILVLPDRADASAALAMHELLIRTQIGTIDAVDIDAAAVVKLDGAALQLLLCWLAMLDSQHVPWRWRAVSETFQHVAALAGLNGALRLSNGIPHEHASH